MTAAAELPPIGVAREAGEAIGSVEDDRLEMAVGRNAPYYRRRWAEMDAKGTRLSWNWAACLLNLYWLGWRKMWAPLALLFLAFVLLALLGAAGPRAGQAGFLASIGLTFLTGFFGNHLYRGKCRRLIDSVADLPPAKAEASLRRRGGTSLTALILSIVLTLALAALIVAGMMMESRALETRQEAANPSFHACGGVDKRPWLA